MVEADLARTNGGLSVSFGGHRLAVDQAVERARPALEGYVGRTVLLGIRPEDFEDARLAPETPPDRRLETVCALSESLGADVLLYFDVEAVSVVPVEVEAGGEAVQAVDPSERKTARGSRLVARVSPRARTADGSPVELAVDTSRLYFFDPETGLAL
jgi:multiple sugar transport system ATP-binding protein